MISDSNMRVGPAYLWSLVAELEDERVGMVTSLFAGTGSGAWGPPSRICSCARPPRPGSRPWTPSAGVRSRWESRWPFDAATWPCWVAFDPSVTCSPKTTCSVGAFWRRASRLEPRSRSWRTETSRARSPRTIERHTRWAKMRRSLNPGAFMAEPVLTPIVVATASVVAAPCKVTAARAGGRVRRADGLCAARGSATSRTRSGLVVRPTRDRQVLCDAALLGDRLREPSDRLARPSVLAAPWKRHRSRGYRAIEWSRWLAGLMAK